LNKKIIFSLLLLFTFAIIFIPQIFADTFSGDDSHGNKISLSLSDGVISGTVTLQNEIISLDEIKVIEKNNRLYMFDTQNYLKIIAKQITPEKYLIIVKHSDEKLRFVASMEDNIKKNIGQRDLFAAMEEKEKQDESNLTFKELEYQKKNNLIIKAQKQYEEKLEKLTECKYTYGSECLSKNSILEDFENYKSSGSKVVRPAEDKTRFILSFTHDIIYNLSMGDSYELHNRVKNIITNDYLENATVQIEISRDDYIIRSDTFESDKFGMVSIIINTLSYPEFYPNLCYEVKLTTKYENHTNIVNESFILGGDGREPYLRYDETWSNSVWDYLPIEFRELPRPSVLKDRNC